MRNIPSTIPSPARRIGTSTTASLSVEPVQLCKGVSTSAGVVFQLLDASASNKIETSCKTRRRNISVVVTLARRTESFDATRGWSTMQSWEFKAGDSRAGDSFAVEENVVNRLRLYRSPSRIRTGDAGILSSTICSPTP